jgi:hypothetical protein
MFIFAVVELRQFAHIPDIILEHNLPSIILEYKNKFLISVALARAIY